MCHTSDDESQRTRPPRYPIRLPVATGETADTAQPWGVAFNVSAGGMFVCTREEHTCGENLRLWFVDERQLRCIEAQVVRRAADGLGVRFDNERFFAWALERVTS